MSALQGKVASPAHKSQGHARHAVPWWACGISGGRDQTHEQLRYSTPRHWILMITSWDTTSILFILIFTHSLPVDSSKFSLLSNIPSQISSIHANFHGVVAFSRTYSYIHGVVAFSRTIHTSGTLKISTVWVASAGKWANSYVCRTKDILDHYVEN